MTNGQGERKKRKGPFDLVPCIVCGRPVSRYGTMCRACGSPQPSKGFSGLIGVGGVIVLLVIAVAYAMFAG